MVTQDTTHTHMHIKIRKIPVRISSCLVLSLVDPPPPLNMQAGMACSLQPGCKQIHDDIANLAANLAWLAGAGIKGEKVGKQPKKSGRGVALDTVLLMRCVFWRISRGTRAIEVQKIKIQLNFFLVAAWSSFVRAKYPSTNKWNNKVNT